MIESSAEALASHCKTLNIFLPYSVLANKNYTKNFLNIKNLHTNKIKYFQRKLLKIGFLSMSLRKKLEKANIVYVHNSNLLKVLRTYFPDKKIILFFHTDKIRQFKEMKYADKVLTVNKAMKNKINSLYSNKALYLPNTLYSIKEYKPLKYYHRNFNKKSNFVIGAMGRLVKKKGFEFLIKTCKEIDNLELVIAGDGNELNNLKKISYNYKNIKLIGWVKNKDTFFKNIDVFCSSSFIEPFGLVIIEAMARGIPVISTKCNGPLDIIKNNKNGMLIEINDKLELKNAIIKFKDNKVLRKKIGLNGYNTYKEKFTFSEYKKNIKSLLKQI